MYTYMIFPKHSSVAELFVFHVGGLGSNPSGGTQNTHENDSKRRYTCTVHIHLYTQSHSNFHLILVL